MSRNHHFSFIEKRKRMPQGGLAPVSNGEWLPSRRVLVGFETSAGLDEANLQRITDDAMLQGCAAG
ncbi:hypothetical protein [Burkholderia glumae]|uniref:Uncharacterized protein n=1 Tax=Burkholderia glumae TaxID=337 RepID=A0AAP9XYB5_BURGL|nr:hypothetical protein [Burkholderia glumae]MCM2485542.1 hypothetical protein [Burkholderia glumae]MCM2511237.1 hypothetical protein [Burkholderia glumae]MCM2541115.1 hypothetical protein [Burkholderia glumae]MCM2552560.1 hypothetical protein [Burkholderia glumae]MCR1769518.1 hypothetical protein [Burkholderia glumae]